MLTNLTQGHLRLLDECPRKFRQVYLEGLSGPPSPDLQNSQLWGNRFHLLMQQRELGLPLLPIPEADLPDCVRSLLASAPDLFHDQPEVFRQSEHRRSWLVNGYSLTVIYDLLILSQTAGQIVDWKTYFQLPNPARLEVDWQTRLYLYGLVETTRLRPDQVTMSYWFVRHRDPQTGQFAPQRIQIAYSQAKHERTHQDLLRLTQALTDYQRTGDFPQVSLEQGRCGDCAFGTVCDRTHPLPLLDLPSLAEVEEVPL